MRRAAVAAVVLLAAVAGCGGSTPEPTLEPGVLRVGVIADLANPRDAEIVNGARVAVTQVDNQGGIDEVLRLRLLVRRARTPQRAAAAARALAAGGAKAFILPCEPVLQAAVAAVTAPRRHLAVAPCNTVPRLWRRFPFTWPAALGSDGEALALAGYLADEDYKRVAVSGRGALVRFLRAALRDRGIGVGAPAQAAVVGPGTPNAPARAAELVAAGTPTVASDALESRRVLRRYGSRLDGLVVAAFGYAEPGDELDEFDVRYRELFGRAPDSTSAARGYDAVRVLAVAIDASDSTRGVDGSSELAEGVDVHGALGTLSYPGRGQRRPKASVAIVRVEKGRLELVDRVEVTPP